MPILNTQGFITNAINFLRGQLALVSPPTVVVMEAVALAPAINQLLNETYDPEHVMEVNLQQPPQQQVMHAGNQQPLQLPQGASSSSDHFPAGVAHPAVHFLTLPDLVRLARTSRTFARDLSATYGQHIDEAVQTLFVQLNHDPNQVPADLMNVLVLNFFREGVYFPTPSYGNLNNLSDDAFRLFMDTYASSQQRWGRRSLRLQEFLTLNRRHRSLLTEGELFSALLDSNGLMDPSVGSRELMLNVYYRILRKSHLKRIGDDRIASLHFKHETESIFSAMTEYVQDHPTPSARANLAKFTELLTMGGFIDPPSPVFWGRCFADLRRLSDSPEDIADNAQTSLLLDANEHCGQSFNTLHSNLSNKKDHDWVRVVLEKGNTYTFVLKATSIGRTFDPYLTLRDANGVEINPDGKPKFGPQKISLAYTAKETDAYFLDVGSSQFKSSGSYELSSTVDVISLKADNDNYLASLTKDKVHQVYKLELKAGHKYEFLMNRASNDIPFDASLYLRDAHQTAIRYDDNSGGWGNSKIIYTAAKDGVYYLDATSPWQKSVGEYTVVSHQVM